jgi:transcriptional regulator with XRE-family HTH domain
MKHNGFLKDLHIGKIIKEIALQKGVSSKKIANVICRYRHNADKIYYLDDMDVEDVVRISYLLEYNILYFVLQKYLPHLPCSDNTANTEYFTMNIDMRNQRVTINEDFNNCDFLKKTHIGQRIKEVAEKRNWNGEELAKRLECARSAVSNLYRCKSLKIKKMVKISVAIRYHLIAEVYLSQMMIASSLNKFENCIIAISQQQIRIVNPVDKNILMVFQRNDDKK